MFNLRIPFRYGFLLPSLSSSHRCSNADYKRRKIRAMRIQRLVQNCTHSQAHSKFGTSPIFIISLFFLDISVPLRIAISINFTQRMKVKFSMWSVSAYNVFCSSYLYFISVNMFFPIAMPLHSRKVQIRTTVNEMMMMSLSMSMLLSCC